MFMLLTDVYVVDRRFKLQITALIMLYLTMKHNCCNSIHNMCVDENNILHVFSPSKIQLLVVWKHGLHMPLDKHIPGRQLL